MTWVSRGGGGEKIPRGRSSARFGSGGGLTSTAPPQLQVPMPQRGPSAPQAAAGCLNVRINGGLVRPESCLGPILAAPEEPGRDARPSLQTPRGGSRHAESKQTITAAAVAKSSPPCSLHHEQRAHNEPPPNPVPTARTRLLGVGGSRGLPLQFLGGSGLNFGWDRPSEAREREKGWGNGPGGWGWSRAWGEPRGWVFGWGVGQSTALR